MTTQTTERENSMSETIKDVYKEHNGLVLEGYLKILTSDESFEFILNTNSEGYKFENESGSLVTLTADGESDILDVNVPDEFFDVSKWRVNRTNKMLNMYMFN